MTKPNRHGKPASSRSSGFALVITLSLMVLLAVLAVGLLSLSSVALRTAGASQYEAEARANARLALMLAIGELQKELGPDQRISARASLLDENTSTDAADGIANPHWLGVWNSWDDWLNNPAIQSTYDKGRTQRFRRWLVSHPNAVQTADLSLAKSSVSPDPVQMAAAYGPGGVPVEVSAVKTAGNGRYAWWITGENQKAHVALTPPEPGSDAAKLHDRSHWQRGKAAWITGLEQAPTDAALLNRSITLPTYGIASADPAPGAPLLLSATLRQWVKFLPPKIRISGVSKEDSRRFLAREVNGKCRRIPC